MTTSNTASKFQARDPRRATLTLTEAANFLGVNDRSLRILRRDYSDKLPTVCVPSSGRGRPALALYKKDVESMKKALNTEDMRGAITR